jgi:hypothetical protein
MVPFRLRLRNVFRRATCSSDVRLAILEELAQPLFIKRSATQLGEATVEDHTEQDTVNTFQYLIMKI